MSAMSNELTPSRGITVFACLLRIAHCGTAARRLQKSREDEHDNLIQEGTTSLRFGTCASSGSLAR